MGMGYFGSVGFMLAQVLLGLLLLLPVLRVILPLSRVRFGNPVCQAVYRATNPLLVPLGRVLPNWRGLSLGALLLAWLVAALAAWLLLAALGNLVGPLEAAALGFGTLLQFTLSLYFWAIVVVALMSFFSPDYGNPAVELVLGVAEPVLKPFRRIPLRFAGFDLSPLWACLALRLLKFSLAYFGLPAFPL